MKVPGINGLIFSCIRTQNPYLHLRMFSRIGVHDAIVISITCSPQSLPLFHAWCWVRSPLQFPNSIICPLRHYIVNADWYRASFQSFNSDVRYKLQPDPNFYHCEEGISDWMPTLKETPLFKIKRIHFNLLFYCFLFTLSWVRQLKLISTEDTIQE